MMTSITPKERKYVECFKSVIDGSCNYCIERSWKTGNKIYAMKQPGGKWIACTDKKCYLDQGGKLTLFKHDPPMAKQPESSDWKLSADEILDLKKAMFERFGIKADSIWYVKILPALRLYRYVKQEEYVL